ncbi:MAG: virulence RhuM family protein [Bacteroidales bacterium]|nr:virulence RhuM family protein [Bacteroidales bacterium]
METKELQMELLLKQDHEGEIALYQPDENINIEVRIDCEKNTVWLSIDQMATLFARDKSVIGKHIRNIFKEGELKKDPVWAKYAYTASDGKTYSVDFYNLDVIISVGYRVRSAQGIAFRIWASKVLKDYLLNGYAVNRQLVALQERTDERFCHLEQRIDRQQDQIDFFIRTNVPPIEGVFYEGQVLDARLFAEKLIRIAAHEIVLIDN